MAGILLYKAPSKKVVLINGNLMSSFLQSSDRTVTRRRSPGVPNHTKPVYSQLFLKGSQSRDALKLRPYRLCRPFPQAHPQNPWKACGWPAMRTSWALCRSAAFAVLVSVYRATTALSDAHWRVWRFSVQRCLGSGVQEFYPRGVPPQARTRT